MRLIDADVLKCEMQRLASDLEGTAESMGGQGLLCKRLNTLAEGVQRGIDMLNEQPTIVERKTGRWMDRGQYTDFSPQHAFRCSECGQHLLEFEMIYDYCPHCGARMVNADGEETK